MYARFTTRDFKCRERRVCPGLYCEEVDFWGILTNLILIIKAYVNMLPQTCEKLLTKDMLQSKCSNSQWTVGLMTLS